MVGTRRHKHQLVSMDSHHDARSLVVEPSRDEDLNCRTYHVEDQNLQYKTNVKVF